MTPTVTEIARRYKSGMIQMDWALYLIVKYGYAEGSWEPILVLSRACRSLQGGGN